MDIKKKQERYKRYHATDKFKETTKRYRNGYLGKKSRMKAKWVSRGVKLRPDETWDDLFCMWYISTNCMICDKDITSNNHKCLDHDHNTGFTRSICCKKCNNTFNQSP